MAALLIITEKWNEQPWFSTGGTRAKKYLQSPEEKFYYFKRSQYKEPTDIKPGKDYKYEFWSEIIASELGKLLGFNILQYDIAIDGEIMGCISESMINSEEEELIEGVKYLQSFSPDYDPTNKSHQKRYTFQLIENALSKAKLKHEIANIAELIIFDALIGNGDRHQENWAIISRQKLMYEAIEEIEKSKEFVKTRRWLKWILMWVKNNMKSHHAIIKEKGKKLPVGFYITENRSAPIYDNGSSLGRELLEEKIEQLLMSEADLNKYIDKGVSEIHWEGEKITHFELVSKLFNSPHKDIISDIIIRVLEKWNGPKIEQIVNEIDNEVPETHNIYKIPNNRKQLIFKIITLRRNRLESLIHERV